MRKRYLVSLLHAWSCFIRNALPSHPSSSLSLLIFMISLSLILYFSFITFAHAIVLHSCMESRGRSPCSIDLRKRCLTRRGACLSSAPCKILVSRCARRASGEKKKGRRRRNKKRMNGREERGTEERGTEENEKERRIRKNRE